MRVATGVVNVENFKKCPNCFPGLYLSSEPSHGVVWQSLKNAIFILMGVITGVVDVEIVLKALENIILVYTFTPRPHMAFFDDV